MRSFLDFYLRMLPFVNVRTKAQFRGTDAPELTGIAALFEETCTQFGTCEFAALLQKKANVPTSNFFAKT